MASIQINVSQQSRVYMVQLLFVWSIIKKPKIFSNLFQYFILDKLGRNKDKQN